MLRSLQNLPDATALKQASLPNDALRKKLQQLGIQSLFHAEVCLKAMIERRTGVLCTEQTTPDQLARILIALERAEVNNLTDSLIRQTTQH